MSKLVFYRLLCFLFLTLACNQGLAPSDPSSKKTGISGTLTFSNWPADSLLFDLRLVAFNNFPPEDIVTEVTEGEAIVYPPLAEGALPFYVDSINYQMELPPGTIGYLVVANQYGTNFLNDWRAVGQYDTTQTDSLPTPIIIEAGKMLTGIDIDVDFDHLPIQPF
jgi:hypothetical protein